MIEEKTLDPIHTEIQVRLALLDFNSQDSSVANKRIDPSLNQITTRTDSPNFLSTKSYLSAY